MGTSPVFETTRPSCSGRADCPRSCAGALGGASVFTGLCGRHDDSLFAPLEKRDFTGSPEQCFLLAYRALLRESFVKRAAVANHEATRELARARDGADYGPRSRFVDAFFAGARAGLATLDHHRHLFDRMLRAQNFDDMRFVIVQLAGVPDIMVSGGWLPSADFDGNPFEDNLRRLGHPHEQPDAVFFSLLGTARGGVGVLAWHRDSDATCEQLAASLVGAVYEGRGDALGWFALLTFENTYFRPSWWSSLEEKAREAIIGRFVELLHPQGLFDPDALRFRLPGVVPDWRPVEVEIRVTHGGDVAVGREVVERRDLLRERES